MDSAGTDAEALATRVLFAPVRQNGIVEQLAAHGRVEAARLATEFGVSTESIRKDLAALEKQGVLQRVHGGAIAVTQRTFEPAIDARTMHHGEKAMIARAALGHVPAGGSILLDAGSTTARLAELLPNSDVLVCTNSLPIALALAGRAGLTVRCLGGTVRRPTLAGVGQIPLDALAILNVDVAFLGTNALSVARGLTTPDEQEAMVKHGMLAAAKRRIVLADHSKLDRDSVCRHAEIGDIDLLITDAGVSRAQRTALERAGVAVQIA